MSSILPPISVMAKWPPPNYVDPDRNRQTLMLASQIPIAALTVIIVGLRLVSRAYLTVSRINADDILILIAAANAVALTILELVAVKWGWGLHAWDLNLAWIKPAQKLAYGIEVTFVLAIAFTKLSILSFYLRVFSAYVAFRKLCWGGIVYIVAWTIGCVVTVIFQCSPIHAFWDIFVVGAKCVDMYTAIMAVSVLNSVSDLYLFGIPIKWVWRLQLPKRQRVGLVIAFGLGLIVCIAGFVRLHYLKLMLHDSYDITWHGASLYIATATEINVGVICASMPALKPLFVHVSTNLSSSHQTTTGSNGGGWSNWSLPSTSAIGVAMTNQSRSYSYSPAGGRKHSETNGYVDLLPLPSSRTRTNSRSESESGWRRSSFAMRWHRANSMTVNEIERVGAGKGNRGGISVQVMYVSGDDEEAQLCVRSTEPEGVVAEIATAADTRESDDGKDDKICQGGSWLL